ncbi:MAG TPA: FliM/FliN family flagellar motor switch protein [Bryobacteraceae bacterium]|nr:FliM/FliN family flagellar motor switch protein [Bryobacteraceae bacterium]
MAETTEPNEAPGNADGPPEQAWLLEEWAQGLARAIEAMGAELPSCQKQDTGERPQGDETLWWAQELSLSPGPSVWIGAAEPAWKEIGAAGLRAVGVDPSNPADVRDTYREILVQSFSSLGRSLTARCEQEVSCLHSEFLASVPDGGITSFVSLQMGQAPAISLCLIASSALLEAIAAKTETGRPPASRDPEKDAQSAVAALRSLADLEMPISISFGTASVPLQDALMLKRGSLVALDRRTDEPVEFRVNDRVIARGEILVVDDSYAIRIVELVSRGERLRCASSAQQAEASLAPPQG